MFSALNMNRIRTMFENRYEYKIIGLPKKRPLNKKLIVTAKCDFEMYYLLYVSIAPDMV